MGTGDLAAVSKAPAMMCAAFDLGTSTGFAFGEKNRDPHYGTWALPGFSDRDFPRSMASIMSSVKAVVQANGVWRVGIEAPLHLKKRSAHTQRCLTMLAGAAIAGAMTGGAQWLRMPGPSTWRKAVLGHGFPENPKAVAMEYCRRLGWSPQDDNAGDALCILHWTISQP